MFEADLVADLRADAGVAAAVGAVGGRPLVDWDARPDGSGLPAVVITAVGEDREYSQSGPVALVGQRVQIDCWAATPLAAVAARNAVREKMHLGSVDKWRAFKVSEGPGDVTDIPGGERVFRRTQDFMCWYQEN